MREVLEEAFRVAVEAAAPAHCLAQYLPKLPNHKKVVVVGAGKAAASMAQALEAAWGATYNISGVIVTRYGHALPLQHIQCLEAAHPIPDRACIEATQQIVAYLKQATAEDRVIVLLSGGGSSLLGAPIDPITLADWQEFTRTLLHSGASIQEMNIVRKHLCQVLGGKLATLSAAPIDCFLISDVADDDISAIASGPTAPDPSTLADVAAIIRRYQLKVPDSVQSALKVAPETPKPGDSRFTSVRHQIIASGRKSLQAAAHYLRQKGIPAYILGETVTGEAREVAKVYAAITQQIRSQQLPFQPPVAILSGGECSVTVRMPGRGGRCSEFLLSWLNTMGAAEGVYGLAADTDGIDGSENNAGAWWSTDDWQSLGLHATQTQLALDKHDAWGFFAQYDRLITTGPTHTNVNDFRLIIIS